MHVEVKLQENRVLVTTDPARPVLPAAIWSAIQDAGFKPFDLELWVEGRVDGDLGGLAVHVDGARWPIEGSAEPRSEPRRLHLGVLDGSADPPRVKLLDPR